MVPRECVGDRAEGPHEANLFDIDQKYGDVMSLDEIIAERGLPDGGTGLPPEVWQAAHEEALRRLDGHLREGRSAVVDDTSCFRFLRDNYREVAARQDAQAKVVFLDVDLEEVQRRRRENEKTQARNAVSEEVMQGLIDSFEYPGEGEEVLAYRPDEEVQVWLQRHF